METLTLAAMVKVLYPGAREESEVSLAVSSCLIKLSAWANLNGVPLQRLSEDAQVKMFISYWKQYTLKVDFLTATDLSTELPRVVDELLELNLADSRDFADRASELTYLITGKDLDDDEYRVEVYKYFYMGLFGRVAKEAKYSINLLFAKFFNTDQPQPLLGALGMRLFPKRLNVCFKRMCGQTSSRTLDKSSIIYTVFQGWKKGMLPLRPDAIDVSLLDHAKALGTQKPLSQELQDSIERTLEESFGDLPKKVEKLVCSKTEDQFWLGDSTLSVKSTTEMSMSGLGQVGLAIVIDRWEPKVSVEDLMAGGLARDLRWHPDTVLCPESLIGFEFVGPNYVGPVYETVRLFDSEIKEILLRVRDLDPSCQPSIVLEPLKARIITKPNSGCYLGMLPLQKFLHTYLKKYSEFQLIGNGAITEEDIWAVSQGWDVGRAWNSGDYSGATDNLKGEISSFIMRWILRNTMLKNPKAYNMIMKSFTECRVDYIKPVLSEDPWAKHYADWKSSDCSIKQKNGQLMGHILSFPILCMANYCAFVESYRRAHKPKPRVLINGDDILFHCTREEYGIWDQTVRDFGFFPSVGKNLFSDQVCQINSVLFKMSTAVQDGRYFLRDVQAVPYCNFGILTNRGKGRGVARTGLPDDLEETELARMPVIGKCMSYLEYLPGDQPTRSREILKKNHKYLTELGVFKWIHPGDGFYPRTFDGVGGRRFARDAGLGSRHVSQLKGVLGEQSILARFFKLKKTALISGSYTEELPPKPYLMPHRDLFRSEVEFVSPDLFIEEMMEDSDDNNNSVLVPIKIQIEETFEEQMDRLRATLRVPCKYSMLEPESVLVY